MTDAVGDEQVQPEEGQGQESEAETETSTTEGAAYGPQAILDQLDEFSQQKVRDQLFEMEKNATSRIESVNKQYEPWKQFESAGYTPDDLAAAVSLAVEVQNNPKVFADRLMKHILESDGDFTPEGFQKAAAEVMAGKDLEGQGKTEEPDDIAKLRKELRDELDSIREQTLQSQQSQQNAEMDRQMAQQVQADEATVKQAHPEYSKDDWQDIYRICDQRNRQNAESGSDDVFTLVQAAETFETMRTRILTSKRPGNLAPKLTPTGGGNAPVDTETRKLSDIGTAKFSEEMGDMFASMLQEGKD